MQLHPRLLASLQLAREQLPGQLLVQPTGLVPLLPLLPHPAAAPADLLLPNHIMRHLMILIMRGRETTRVITMTAAAAAVDGKTAEMMAAARTREGRMQMVMRTMRTPCKCRTSSMACGRGTRAASARWGLGWAALA
jgi:hypothetical protein